ncbi:hypothetical protein [Vibrio sp. CAU 1672]|nr:hypothetical protein [Vibrio sp. CAU 1672]MDF2153256.1 hypothetical protein [Vibrio sp. CAU 1672]
MHKIINTIGMMIIAGKYALFILLAGLTVATGVNAADPALIMGLEGNE